MCVYVIYICVCVRKTSWECLFTKSIERGPVVAVVVVAATSRARFSSSAMRSESGKGFAEAVGEKILSPKISKELSKDCNCEVNAMTEGDASRAGNGKETRTPAADSTTTSRRSVHSTATRTKRQVWKYDTPPPPPPPALTIRSFWREKATSRCGGTGVFSTTPGAGLLSELAALEVLMERSRGAARRCRVEDSGSSMRRSDMIGFDCRRCRIWNCRL